MPIFMDRHDVSDSVTAEKVAQMHQEDLKIQDQFGCRGLTYWFDGLRKTAFCLIEAPDRKSLEDMHNKAHGEVPHSIIEVDASIVESFLGRIEDPQKAHDTTLNIINDPAFRIIMVMEFSELTLKQKDSDPYLTTLDKFNNAVPEILNSYSGTIVKKKINCYLVSFISVSNSVHAAIDLLALYKHFTRDLKQEKNIFKIGLSAGVPVTERQSIFEDSIKSAERMCAAVNAEIIISSEVKDLYNNENLKGISESKNIVALSNTDELFLNQLMEHTEKNWDNVNLKAIDYCKPTGCSKSQLYRKMILLTGKSPNTFIKEFRLEAALKLLNKKSGNISEIAFDTGFSSPSYFSKCFQKRYGHSPSEYLLPKSGH